MTAASLVESAQVASSTRNEGIFSFRMNEAVLMQGAAKVQVAAYGVDERLASGSAALAV